MLPLVGRGGGLVGAGHHQPDLLPWGLGWHDADDPAVVHHRDPVGEGEDLVELGRDQHHGRPAVALGDDPAVDELDGAHVDAAGGLGGDEHLQVAGELAGHDDLLLVAARQRADGGLRALGADVELLDPLAGVAGDGLAAHGRPAGELLLAEQVEHQVLAHAEAADVAVVGAVLGDVADPALQALARPVPGDLLAVEEHPSLVGAHEAQQRLDQLGLPVALDPGDPEDLTGPGLEGDVLDHLVAADVDDRDVLGAQHRRAGLGLGLVDGQLDRASDHQLGQLGLAGVRGGGPHDLAAADHRDPVADGLDLAQLVGDEDDRGALGLEPAHDLHQLVDLLGREHRGGLVQDQHLGVVGQRLEDLHPLLHADRQVLDQPVGVDGEAVALGEGPHGRRGPAAVQDAAQPRLLAPEHHVLGHGEDRHEHEVLVDHADAGRDRLARARRSGPARRRRGSRPPWAPAARRACSSGSTCPRRSHPAGSGSRRARRSGRCGRSP